MILVKYGFEEGHYSYLNVKGHAMSDDFGKDLICAGVSSIMFGLMNEKVFAYNLPYNGRRV